VSAQRFQDGKAPRKTPNIMLGCPWFFKVKAATESLRRRLPMIQGDACDRIL